MMNLVMRCTYLTKKIMKSVLKCYYLFYRNRGVWLNELPVYFAVIVLLLLFGFSVGSGFSLIFVLLAVSWGYLYYRKCRIEIEKRRVFYRLIDMSQECIKDMKKNNKLLILIGDVLKIQESQIRSLKKQKKL